MNGQLRELFYANYPHFHHTFDDGEYYLDYALYGTLPLSGKLQTKIEYAVPIMYGVLEKVGHYILSLPEKEQLKLGYHKSILPYLHLQATNYSSVASRFDIIRTEDGFKFIEMNSDTPFLIMENFIMDDELSNHFGTVVTKSNRANILANALSRSLAQSAEYLCKDLKDCTVAIMGYAYEEDLEEFTTLSFYRQLVETVGVPCHYVHYNDVHVDMEQRDVNTAKLGTIDILLKFAYPYDFLIRDTYNDREGNIGIDMMQLMKEKRVVLLNQPTSHITQSKGVFAVIWDRLEKDRTFFTSEERRVIEEHVAYTTFNGRHFPLRGDDYVRKPVFSREGQSVEIIRKNAKEITTSSIDLYKDELMVYQEYIQQPTREVVVQDEKTTLQEVMGVFMVEGRYAGAVCRLGGTITDWYSHWVPLHLTK